ncbi:OsmC family protein [Brachybacterium sp. GCM10030268]|uniref:OsmC family protein n=1 Tax=Brachybacterium sp. GCM10030268 TaxID=3273382 RepID=UPI00360661D7
MSSVPDDRFELPEDFGPGSVWADRSGHRTLVGRNQRGVEIPIGLGEGEISPGELLKLAVIGCAGMSSDVNLSRRLGEDFDMRLWAHGLSEDSDNRYHSIAEQVQLPVEQLTEAETAEITKVFGRAVAAGCTVERTIVPGVEVTHEVLGGAGAAAEAETAHGSAESSLPATGEDAEATGQVER